jgi:membrane protein
MLGRPSLWRLGGLGVRELAIRVWNAADADEIMPRAGALSYAFLFSIFPLLLFVAALLSLVPVHHVIRQLMDSAAQVLPGEAATTVRNTLRQIIAGRGYRGLISLGAVTALWAGSTGIATLMSMLNVVHGTRDQRPWWKRKLIAVMLTTLLAVFVIVSALLIMLSARIGVALGTVGNVLTALAPVVLVLIAVDLMYCVAPACRRPGRFGTPGAVTFAVLWLAMSFGLRVYVSHFANYNVMYGSIGGLILFMLWLFLSSVALLLGAEVNRAIVEANRRDVPAETSRRARSLTGARPVAP